jgi:hypothetical protein
MQTFLVYRGVARGALAAAGLAGAGGALAGSRVAGHFGCVVRFGGVGLRCFGRRLMCCGCVRMVYIFTRREESVLILSAQQQRRTFDRCLGLPA